ncbi:hypothetical protein C8Q76DRAFT_422750 [Earliella scabrosa]|nr:hypothetical protein C8Q76DRAFT_422750 [Earliella scabrosa]
MHPCSRHSGHVLWCLPIHAGLPEHRATYSAFRPSPPAPASSRDVRRRTVPILQLHPLASQPGAPLRHVSKLGDGGPVLCANHVLHRLPDKPRTRPLLCSERSSYPASWATTRRLALFWGRTRGVPKPRFPQVGDSGDDGSSTTIFQDHFSTAPASLRRLTLMLRTPFWFYRRRVPTVAGLWDLASLDRPWFTQRFVHLESVSVELKGVGRLRGTLETTVWEALPELQASGLLRIERVDTEREDGPDSW